MADGIVATVNDRIITGYDLRQRMLLIIVMSEVQPTAENIAQMNQQADYNQFQQQPQKVPHLQQV